MNYLNHRMPDGSRLFAELPAISMSTLRVHLVRLEGVLLGEEVSDGVAEGWLDFTCHGQRFTVHDSGSELRVFANNAECSPDILTELMGHFWLLQVY